MVRGPGWYYIEVDKETGDHTGHVCEGWYSGDRPVDSKPGCTWILVRYVEEEGFDGLRHLHAFPGDEGR